MAKNNPPTVLIADDDPDALRLIGYHLKSVGIKFVAFPTGKELIEHLNDKVRVVVTDLKMPDVGGFSVLEQVKSKFSNIEVIFLTSNNAAADAIKALRDGASDYITKPFDPDELIHAIKKSLEFNRLNQENRELKQTIDSSAPLAHFIGEDPVILKLVDKVPRIGKTDHTVLLTGESGTGKGVFARYIHHHSNRAAGPFITVSCPAMPRDLIESELFGHEKGAFSGAVQRRLGRAEMADGGTLFLDEIGELPLELQAKLLNFLQERSFYRIGGQQLVRTNVRIVAATNRDLAKMVEEGKFREDLYYRINVLPLVLPPLRERPSDIVPLAYHFIKKYYKEEESTDVFLPEVKEFLSRYIWPGNIRELENVMERILTYCDLKSSITINDLPDEITAKRESTDEKTTEHLKLAGLTLQEIEKRAIEQTILECKGNKVKSARMLGISEKSIYNKLNRFGIN